VLICIAAWARPYFSADTVFADKRSMSCRRAACRLGDWRTRRGRQNSAQTHSCNPNINVQYRPQRRRQADNMSYKVAKIDAITPAVWARRGRETRASVAPAMQYDSKIVSILAKPDSAQIIIFIKHALGFQ